MLDGVGRVPRWLLATGAGLCVLVFVVSAVVVVTRSRGDATASVQPPPGAGSSPPAGPVQRVFPVVPLPGEPVSYARTHHGYPASDILTECGGSYVAPVSGVIDNVSRVDQWDPRTNRGVTRGGRSVAMIGDDGVRYYGSHFQSINENIKRGVRVNAGDPIAIIGRSGDAGACHVHFGLSPDCGKGDWFVRRGVVWPWPYLDSWRSGGNADPAPEIQQWLTDRGGCPTEPAVEA